MIDKNAELRAEVDRLTWFHSIDFGNGIVAPGVKPLALLNLEADAFFGGLSLEGRTFLDIGAWNGFFSFEAKRRGASRVLATDKFTWTNHLRGREGFELARCHLGYEIEAEEIDVPDLAVNRIGMFDVVLFAGVFYHLFEAPRLLKQIATLATRLLVVETHQDLLDFDRPAMVYYPGSTLLGDDTNYWGPNPPLMVELLRESEFYEIHYQPHPGDTIGHGRGIYLAFRDRDCMRDLGYTPGKGLWRDLNRQPAREPTQSPAPLTAQQNPK